MFFFKSIAAVLFSVLLFSGCSIKGHPYQPDFNSINYLKDQNLQKMSVNGSESSDESDEEVSLRAANMVSPYGGSFTTYLQKSLQEHLQQAALYDKHSKIKITATLIRNDVDISGFSIGTADLSAKFQVENDGTNVYNKELSIHHEWDSSFIGQIAIENALDNYPVAMQKLIDAFLSDKTFLESVK
ncbi:hypothetical protein WCX49_00735 [Sulfurimonas sp. HSL-1656]|uniref:hypothetical protein n=1 Tax=Thiomicrolovo subterrani TaxID=3131934 RepID=UPI0031F8EBA2